MGNSFLFTARSRHGCFLQLIMQPGVAVVPHKPLCPCRNSAEGALAGDALLHAKQTAKPRHLQGML
eukprot:12211320-Alexandrium_andersonii.AAC.1